MHVLGHRTLLVARKIRKIANSTYKSPPSHTKLCLWAKDKAKDSKFVLVDTSRPRTKAKDTNTAVGSIAEDLKKTGYRLLASFNAVKRWLNIHFASASFLC